MVAEAISDRKIEGIFLEDILRILWRRKWIFAVGLAFSLRAKPIFTATSKFVCTGSDNSRASDLGALASLAGIKTSSSSSSDPSLYFNDILEDDEFLGKVLQKKWACRGDSLTLMQIYTLRPDTASEDWEYRFLKSNIGKLKKGKTITLTKNRGNGVFLLETRFSDPKLAYQVNRYVIEFLDHYLRTSMLTKTREKRNFIEKRLVEIESELNDGEDELMVFQQRNKDVFSPNILTQQSRLERSVRINQELYLQLKKEFEMAKIEEKNDTPLLELLSKPSVPVGKSAGKSRFFPLAGLAIGLGLGAVSALVLGWYRKDWA